MWRFCTLIVIIIKPFDGLQYEKGKKKQTVWWHLLLLLTYYYPFSNLASMFILYAVWLSINILLSFSKKKKGS